MRAYRLGIYLLGLLLLVGCHKTFPVTEVEPSFDICEPPRGQDQDEVTQLRGKAFDSLQHGCT